MDQDKKNMIEVKIKKDFFDKREVVKKIEGHLNNCGLDKKYIGNMIRGFHIASPVCAIIIICFAPRILVWLTIFYLLLVIVFFVLFNGCVLSILETKYLKDEFNIVDPFLCIMGAEVNNSNRMQISAILMFFYLLTIFVIYNLRYQTTIPQRLLSFLPEYLR